MRLLWGGGNADIKCLVFIFRGPLIGHLFVITTCGGALVDFFGS